MRRLRKHHRVSIGVMRDIYARDDAKLGREESANLCADALTKPLDAETLNRHLAEMGFIEIGDSDEEVQSENGVCVG